MQPTNFAMLLLSVKALTPAVALQTPPRGGISHAGSNRVLFPALIQQQEIKSRPGDGGGRGDFAKRYVINNDIISEDEVTSLPSASSSSFANFDYESCWYPVIWAEDVPLHRPIKVTVFDTDYVLGKTSDDSVTAMEDRCPHKSAALSEGRITSKGHFQCAYHGWKFDGKDGTCVEIPQIMTNKNQEDTSSSFSSSKRSCGTAVPAMISQGMIWLFPGGNLEKALLAPPPPQIPEIDMEGFKSFHTVRDFPVDWTLLLENIVDPDHGLFAHNAKGKAFDLYSASKEFPMEVEEEFGGKGWTITSRVPAKLKLTALPRSPLSAKKKKEEDDEIKLWSTSTFTAPAFVSSSRRDKDGQTAFITAFYICPVGTGKSRFMSCTVGKIPIDIPRWVNHVFLNNFIDQDTFLLATQQAKILPQEAEAAKKELKKNANNSNDVSQITDTKLRKKTFVYRSPSEKLNMRLGSFWDQTLSRAPRRVEKLLEMERSGRLSSLPSKREVLDRKAQHLDICPDSQKVVQNCETIHRASALVSSLVLLTKWWAFTTMKLALTTTGWAARLNNLLRPKFVYSILAFSLFSSWIARKIRRQFFFKYDEEYRNKDMDMIPKMWADEA